MILNVGRTAEPDPGNAGEGKNIVMNASLPVKGAFFYG
jgi:hypothetical protein